jgi:hypothetical protein
MAGQLDFILGRNFLNVYLEKSRLEVDAKGISLCSAQCSIGPTQLRPGISTVSTISDNSKDVKKSSLFDSYYNTQSLNVDSALSRISYMNLP